MSPPSEVVRIFSFDATPAEGPGGLPEFLQAIEEAQEALGVRAAPRHYRRHFSMGYKAVFPDQQRRYCVDILQAAMQNDTQMLLNGVLLHFGPASLRSGEELQRQWWQLQEFFRSQSTNSVDLDGLRAVFRALDAAWANFEEAHILELMRFEDWGRQPLLHAAELEAELEQSQSDDATALLQGLSHLCKLVDVPLNAVTCGEVLANAEMHCRSQLAKHVNAAYLRVRRYLQEARTSPQLLDPELCQNRMLMALLEELQSSVDFASGCDWTLFQILLDKLQLLTSGSELFLQMRVDRSAALFLALPRLVLLCVQPSQVLFLKRLLPDCWHDEIIFEQFHAFLQLGQQLKAALAQEDDADARRILMHVALHGPSSHGTLELRSDLALQLAGFCHQLERWSMQLQRVQPQEWNRHAAVILECMADVPTY